MRKTIVGFSLFVLFAAACCLASFAGFATGKQPAARSVPLTLRSVLTYYNADGSVYATREVTRYESASGSYREVVTGGGGTQEHFFEQGRGFFTVNRKRGQLVREPRASNFRENFITAQELLSSPQFVRTDLLLGHTAYVKQIKDEQSGILMSEVYTVPEWGRSFAKIVNYDPKGNVTYILEPISVTEGEPAASDVHGPDLPEATRAPR